jgi:hypothetical protein
MRIVATIFYLAAFAGLFFGCAHVDSTRAALVLIGEIGEPAYEATYEACNALHAANPDHPSLRTCDRVIDALESIAVLDNEAVDAFERGDIDRAEQLLADIRHAWAKLKEKP